MEWIYLLPFLAIALAVLCALIFIGLTVSPGQNPLWVLQIEHYLQAIWSGLLRPHVGRGMFAGVVIGGVVALVMVAIAWSHNPQGAIHGPEGVSWLYVFALALAWFVVAGTTVATVVTLALAVTTKRRPPVG